MEKQLPQWVFRPQFLFFVFFVCFFSIAIQLKSRKWKTKLRLTSNKQSLTWLVLTPAPLVDILSVRDYFYPDNLLYPHINIYIYIFFFFFFFFLFQSALYSCIADFLIGQISPSNSSKEKLNS